MKDDNDSNLELSLEARNKIAEDLCVYMHDKFLVSGVRTMDTAVDILVRSVLGNIWSASTEGRERINALTFSVAFITAVELMSKEEEVKTTKEERAMSPADIDTNCEKYCRKPGLDPAMAEMHNLGWHFVPTAPEEWQWVKLNKKQQSIAMQGDKTWEQDYKACNGTFYKGCRGKKND